MPTIALDKMGAPIDAELFTSEQWEQLKAYAALGDFVMPCCKAPAVLKTSLNGLPFFAHASDQCNTAPETVWHREGKAAVIAKLAVMGIQCRDEVSGGTAKNRWEADTLFQYQDRTIVIELQRSYQHLRDYLRRQKRYEDSRVECFWLLRKENFHTYVNASTRYRWINEFDRTMPSEGTFGPFVRQVPIGLLSLDEGAKVGFGQFRFASLEDWLKAIIDSRFLYDDGWWKVI